MVALALLLTMGCAAERSLFGVDGQPGGSRGSGIDLALVGAWEAVLLIEAGLDLQTWTTRWAFNGDGSCRFTRTIRSLLEGVDRITDRPCRWSAANAAVSVTYPADESTSRLPYSFAGFDPNRLVLEGIEYARVTGR